MLGSLDDAADLEKLASESDIVFQTVSPLRVILAFAMYRRHIWNLQADADHLEGTKAILRGFKTRFQKTGVAPILIHTVSSTSVSETCSETHPVASPF